MTAPRRLDRKVRITLGAMIILLLIGPIFALRNCVSDLQDPNQLIAPEHATDDHLVSLGNGTTMLLDRGPLGQKIAYWLKLNTDEKIAFEIADTNFAPDSSDPTSKGLSHIAQIAQVMTADPQLRVQVVVATGQSDPDSAVQLEKSRASRVRKELVRQRVAPENVSSITQSFSTLETSHIVDHPGQHPSLFLVFSR